MDRSAIRRGKRRASTSPDRGEGAGESAGQRLKSHDEPVDPNERRPPKIRRVEEERSGGVRLQGAPSPPDRRQGLPGGGVRLTNAASAGRAPPEVDSDEEMMNSSNSSRDSRSTPGRFWNRRGRTRQGLDQRLPKKNQKQWLASNENWWWGLGKEFVGVKVLGIGGFGLVGLWEYKANNGDVTRVVVKQSRGQDQMLRTESRLLYEIAKTNTRHVVKLLKQYHEEGGGGSSWWDPDGMLVSRIYLEYCEHGDMLAFLKLAYDQFWTVADLIPEEYIWAIWECLARGLCVLAYGNENLDGEVWDRPEIMHLDIKPHNILVGGNDEQHDLTEKTFKIADLGLAVDVPPKRPQFPDFIKKYARGGTWGWRAPEQMYAKTPNRMLGTPTNVWQIARCMYATIRLGRTFDMKKTFRYRPPGETHSFETYGRKILREEFEDYSDRLKATLLRCLACDPTRRPTPRELLRECIEATNSLEPDLKSVPGIPAAPIKEIQPQNDEAGIFGVWSSDWRENELPDVIGDDSEEREAQAEEGDESEPGGVAIGDVDEDEDEDEDEADDDDLDPMDVGDS